MKPLTAGLAAVGTIVAAAGLAACGAPRAAVLHLVFAAGILPLILSAMLHFVPVLTRTGAPPRAMMAIPGISMGIGWLLTLTLAGWLPAIGITVFALIDFVMAGTLLGWIVTRARKTVGAPHPGNRWYVASLAILAVALLAIASLALLPESFRILRAAHLHLNLLGFIGMAAFGTLPVLLPTTLGLADPAAATWLLRSNVGFFGACLLIAGSATLRAAHFDAVAAGLGFAGLVVLSLVVIRLLRHWLRDLKLVSIPQSPASMSLVAAACGFQAVLVLGFLHGLGIVDAAASVPGFIGLFLLPLVSGALTQLLPVWRLPGPETPRRMRMAAAMGKFNRTRIACFQCGGALFAFGVDDLALAAVGSGIALFVTATVSGLIESRAAGG